MSLSEDQQKQFAQDVEKAMKSASSQVLHALICVSRCLQGCLMCPLSMCLHRGEYSVHQNSAFCASESKDQGNFQVIRGLSPFSTHFVPGIALKIIEAPG